MPFVVPRLIVELFDQPYFRGRSGLVYEPIRYTGFIGFQDNISSVRIYKGPNYASSPNYKAIFHEHIDFQGKRLALGPGFYPNLHDMTYNFGNVVSSISFGPSLEVAGPEWGTVPLVVEVYEHINFQGRKAVILRDIPHTQQIGLHDRISSVRILKGPDCPPTGARVLFYEHIDFEGAILPIEIRPMDFKKEIPNLHALPQSFGDIISSIKIEGWSSSSEFSEIVFQDEFDGTQMRPEWRWEDPKGGGTWAERQGYLEMRVEPGQDLWHGNPPGQGGNMDAPRLLQPISGDFAIETRIRVTPQLREHGGLLVWKDPNAFVRLEKTSGPHAFRGDVRFERHVNRVYSLVGRGAGLSHVKTLYLRLERKGNLFSGYASADGVNWLSCGSTFVGMGDPVHVGLHALCPGNIPPTITRFDYFRILRRRSEAALYRRVAQPSAAQQRQMSETQRLAQLRQLT